MASYVAMMLRPAGRFLTGPRPPLVAAARILAAVIRPPRDFFAISITFFCFGFDSLPTLTSQVSQPSMVSIRSRFHDSPRTRDYGLPLANGVPCDGCAGIGGILSVSR